MKKNLLLIIGSMILSYVASAQVKQGGIIKESLSVDSFRSTVESTPNAVLLDVRTPEEVSHGIIAGAVNIDFNSPDFEQKISALDKRKTYFVYCAKGVRSGKAVEEMSKLGFSKLYNLEGGFVGWKEKGMPVAIK